MFPLNARVVVTAWDGRKLHGTAAMVDSSYFTHRYGIYLDDGTEGMVSEDYMELENPLLALSEVVDAPFRSGDAVLFGPSKIPATIGMAWADKEEVLINIPSPKPGGWGTTKYLKDTQTLEHASPVVALSRAHDKT